MSLLSHLPFGRLVQQKNIVHLADSTKNKDVSNKLT